MGFFEEHPQDTGGGLYIKKDEKLVIAQSGIPFDVTEVIVDEDNVFEGKKQPRYIVVMQLPSPESGEVEERRLSFPIGSNVESRDRMLGQLADWLEAGNDPVTLKLAKVGRAYVLKDASPEA